MAALCWEHERMRLACIWEVCGLGSQAQQLGRTPSSSFQPRWQQLLGGMQPLHADSGRPRLQHMHKCTGQLLLVSQQDWTLDVVFSRLQMSSHYAA